MAVKTSAIDNAAKRAFETGFLSSPVADQAATCDTYDLAPRFLEEFSTANPVLEAGSGSGRWVYWLTNNGIPTIGIEWSYPLCIAAKSQIEKGHFVQGDMRQLPFAAGSLGGILSLGAVEHSIEGPEGSLTEYERCLRPGGVAIVTVPYLGPIRRPVRLMREPAKRVKAWPAVRRLFRKRPVPGAKLSAVQRTTRPGWFAEFHPSPSTGWEFYQYELTRRQMREALSVTRLRVREEFAFAHDEGILHTFGRLGGRWDAHEKRVRLTPVGRVLRRALPCRWSGHMLCYVLER